MTADELGREPERIAAGQRLSLRQLAAVVDVPQAALQRARDLKLMPPPDTADGRWSATAAEEINRQWPQTAAALQAGRELGLVRCAEMLTRVTGLQVGRAHVEELAARGSLKVSRFYRQQPLFRVADLHALTADPAGLALLAEIVTAEDGTC